MSDVGHGPVGHGPVGHDPGGHEPGGHDPGEQEQGEHVHGHGTHGMLVVGIDRISASHLPMFDAPHDFQLVAEVELEAGDAETYRQDRRTSGKPVYTLEPEKFAWSELLPEGDKPPTRTSFKADVFQGHFERPGKKKIITGATVEVRNVDYFSKLVATDTPSQHLTYRAVGRGNDLFLYHEIRGAPNFDHVVSFRFEEPVLGEGEQLTGAPVLITGRADSVDDRLQPKESVNALLPQTIGPEGQHGFSTQLTVLEEMYLEIRELSG